MQYRVPVLMLLAGLALRGVEAEAAPPPVNFADTPPAVSHYGLTRELAPARQFSDYYQGPYPAPPPAPSPLELLPARINVRVPADAEVWIGGMLTTQKGDIRQFITPLLDPERTYSYVVRARWKQEGRTVDRSFKVRFQAGNRVMVNFLRPVPAPGTVRQVIPIDRPPPRDFSPPP